MTLWSPRSHHAKKRPADRSARTLTEKRQRGTRQENGVQRAVRGQRGRRKAGAKAALLGSR